MTNSPLSTSERLVQSRERMRLAVLELGYPGRENASGSAKTFSDNLLKSLTTTPGSDLLLSLVRDWWSRQPLRTSLTLACDTAQVVLQPVAQRHPLGLVMSAAVAGALIVLAKPWRWVSKPDLLSGLLPQLLAQVMQQTTTMAVGSHAKNR